MTDYIKVFTDSTLIINRLKSILEQNSIYSKVKSDKIIGYEITTNIDDLYILNSDLKKATPIIENFRKEISK